MKISLIIIGITLLLVVGAMWWSSTQSGTRQSDPNIVSQNGLHWHPQLTISVKGQMQEIPQNIGLGAVHQPMHTHEDLPIIHLEFGGIVRKQDLTLGQFFKVWGKEFTSFGSNAAMTVNGEENTEFESYHMKDGDKIELRYD